MSVAKNIVFALALYSSSATAETLNPYSGNDPEYMMWVSQYAKEMVAARYGAKHCPAQIVVNEHYFDRAPPILWPQDRFKKFISTSMQMTKSKMEEHRQMLLGHYCSTFIQFVESNYPANDRPVFIKK